MSRSKSAITPDTKVADLLQKRGFRVTMLPLQEGLVRTLVER